MGDIAAAHQIHGVQPVLPVPDVAAAADWFCRTLGFTVDFLHGEPAVHGRVKAGDGSWGQPVYLHLSLVAVPVAAGGETRLHVGHDIDGLHAHALAQGARVLQPPIDRPWGLREMVLEAPGGHAIRLGAELGHVQPDAPPRPVIACYRPRPGQADTLRALVQSHVPALQRLGLATDRAPLQMVAADGSIVEVFEWVSAAAVAAAHGHPDVQAIWTAFGAVCDFPPLSGLAEAQRPFAEFAPFHA